ncbi:MAG: YihY/virulence factor BrkB family protein [Anaerolineae bacterium]|nr:YihY/virulence factor BrkB family protein [Anaerolineae bacterium]
MKTALYLLRDAAKAFSEDNVSRLAAALAYYTLFSVAPLLVIAIGITGLVIGQGEAQTEIVAQIEAAAGPQVAEALAGMIDTVSRPGAGGRATLIGILVLMWGASQVLTQLKDSFNTIWKVTPPPEAGIWLTIRQRLISLSMVLTVGFLMLVSLIFSAAIATLSQLLTETIPALRVALPLVDGISSVLLMTPLFALIFKSMPDTPLTWRDVAIGGVVTAVLFLLGKLLISFYLGYTGVASAYGAAGSLIVILLWVYYSAQLLFFGAEITKVYTYQFGSRRPVPTDG